MTGAQGQANAYTGIGNAQAAGTVGSANAWQNALGGGVNAINQYVSKQVVPGDTSNNSAAANLYGGGSGSASGVMGTFPGISNPFTSTGPGL